MITRDSNYIDGRWQPASGTERFDVTDSATEQIIGTVTAATAADADSAVAAARQEILSENWDGLLLPSQVSAAMLPCGLTSSGSVSAVTL